MLLVGPDEMVSTGKRAAKSVSIRVPSFWLMKSGALMPSCSRASEMPWTVRWATSPRQALSAAAFSRSSKPMRPFSWERQTRRSGASSWMRAAASFSWRGSTGEKTPHTATARMPWRSMARTASRMPSRSREEISRPSNSLPPPTMYVWPPTAARSSSGQSTRGGSSWVAGRHNRSTAVGARSRRSSRALVK